MAAATATLAPDLLRTITRAFYPVEHTLVLETLLAHSTLPDADLAYLLSMQPKLVKRVLGRLKEDGIVSAVTRQEKRTDGGGSFFPSSRGGAAGGDGAQGKERMTNREWWYLNYHHAIDRIKYRLHKLNAHFTALGAPTTAKKDLLCPQCGNSYTIEEVLHKVDDSGFFRCDRCDHVLDDVPEEDRVAENESVKRLNSQVEKILNLMQRIDAAAVPENDWDTALAAYRPVVRTDANPASRTETVDMPGRNGVQSSKGLKVEPEKIGVSLLSEEDIKLQAAEADRLRREKEAGQNALPEWIAKSTVSGAITGVGAVEEQKRREREANGGVLLTKEEEEERKPDKGNRDLDAYFAELERQTAQDKAAEEEEDEEDDDDDEGDFEDVALPGTSTPAAPPNGAPPTVNGNANGNGKRPASGGTGTSTPDLISSNATDDERDAKRPRYEMSGGLGSGPGTGPVAVKGILDGMVNGAVGKEKVPEATPAASDEDEDELEFENV